jgi:hypothetical protein
MKRLTFIAISLALLAGCVAEKAPQQARVPAPAPRQAAMPAPVPQPPRPAAPAPASHAVADPGEAVWHLRSGLNVAALSCRGKGRTPVSPDYARLLTRHKALLASAYAGEQRRYGKGLDRHLTQLYNRFAFQRSPERFCASAAAVAAEAVRIDSPTLSARAHTLLDRI